MAEQYAITRRFPHVKVLRNATGEVSLLHDVTLLDLSERGARLEYTGGFAVKAICFRLLQHALRLRSVPHPNLAGKRSARADRLIRLLGRPFLLLRFPQ